MGFRARIGTIMIGVAVIGLGLASWIEWRRSATSLPSSAVRIAREVLAERTARRSPGPSMADSATVAAFALAAVVASKAIRAVSGRRADSLRAGRRPGR